MTTAQTIIDDAYREAQLIPVGASPTTDERTEALRRLNAFIQSLLGFELGELTSEWQVPPRSNASVKARFPLAPADNALPSDVWPYPPPNVQLSTKISAATTVYLDLDPCDGARIKLSDAGSTAALTIDANGRLIEGASTLVLSDLPNDAPREWFYRKDLGDWVRVTTLTLPDQLFFPAIFDDLFITGLAMRLAPRNGQSVSGETAVVYRQMLKKFKAQYRQRRAQPSDYDLRMRTRQSYPTDFSL